MNNGNFATVGGFDGNEVYLGQRLQYQALDPEMSGIVQPIHLLLFYTRAVLVGTVAFVVGAIFGLLLVISGDDSGIGFGIAFVLSAIAAIWTLFIPYREGLSEWQLSIEDKGAQADMAFASIYSTLQARFIPVKASTRRFKSTGDSRVNNYLVLQDGDHAAYVSVFAYGSSLYVGWTLWRQRRPIKMIFRYIRESFGEAVGSQASFRAMLAANRARAMRETVHAAVREGIDLVNSGQAKDIPSTFGHDIAVETLGEIAQPPVPPRPVAPPTSSSVGR